MESAICTGVVNHERFKPTQHAFEYGIAMMWLNLDEVNHLAHTVKGFSNTARAAFEFRRSDYLGDPTLPLKQAVIARMNELNKAKVSLTGDIFLLGQARHYGLYFSPVNFYFLRHKVSGQFTHMLAEVSNTPWNERHHYLVDLKEQSDTEKAFHVSPFNPIDMTYKWHIGEPDETFTLIMDCFSAKKDFSAGFKLNRLPMNSDTLGYVMRRTPSMTIKTVLGIYWQALKLWIKRTPVYSHP